MEDKIASLLGEGPYPFPIDKLDEFLEYYTCRFMNVCILRMPISMYEDMNGHCHESYEFLIPSTTMPYIGVDKKNIYMDRNFVLPINGGQFHGPMKEMHDCHFSGFHISRSFLGEIAFSIYGTSEFNFDNQPLILTNEVKRLMATFVDEARNQQAGCDFILEGISTQLVVNMLRQAKSKQPYERHNCNPLSYDNISRVIEFLRENYSKDYSTSDAAGVANLSNYHFIRAFKARTGKTPYEFLIDVKIEKAKELLEHNSCSITEICFLCGFSNHSHFSTTFKKKWGVSPSEYRKIILNK